MRTARTARTIPVLVVVCLLTLPAPAQYSGGSGTAEDPYQIATAEDLIALGETPGDYDKHFILTADIDLDPNLPGGRVFDRAIIAPDTNDVTWAEFDGPPFTGVFNGEGHKISNLALTGYSYLGLFGYLDSGAMVSNLDLEAVNVDGGAFCIGGLAGYNSGGITDSYCYGMISAEGSLSRVGGLVGYNDYNGNVTASYSTGTVSGGEFNVGGLVGRNDGIVTASYSTGTVSGGGGVGGLVGINNEGYIADSYSTGTVGGMDSVGGLVGWNLDGSITSSYSTGAVSGDSSVGGLVGGREVGGSVFSSFWDTQTSGQNEGDGGTGLPTAEMQTASTFLEAGWDFVDETTNGTDDIWWILEGADYPRFPWERGPARLSHPADGTVDVAQPPILRWRPGGPFLQHDVYLSEDEATLRNATPESLGVYRGRQPLEMTTYEPSDLKWGVTYYWRIDQVDEADASIIWKGDVWGFTTADYIVVSVADDFESYTDDMKAGQAIFQTWLDGWFHISDPNDPNDGPSYEGNGTGALVGNSVPPLAEQNIVHAGLQSMPLYFHNNGYIPGLSEGTRPYYSETVRTWDTPQDWTTDEADTLTLYVRGEADNDQELLYVAIEDDAGQIAVVTHVDANAVLATEWQKWHIALADLQAGGVDASSVKKMYIGVGDRDDPQLGGTGVIYIDDIRVTNRMP